MTDQERDRQIRAACEAARLTEESDPHCIALPCCAGDHPVANVWKVSLEGWRLECQLCERPPLSMTTGEVFEAVGLKGAA